MFKEFTYISDFNYHSGWDRYALDYEKLLVPDTVYFLTKLLMHNLIDRQLGGRNNRKLNVLDINCGTGNDFPFFFDRGWQVMGCDGSEGMLNRAYFNYKNEIKSGQLKLLSGMIEDIEENTFAHEQFDLVFSITGGFSYVSDDQLKAINNRLSRFVKKDGLLVVAHLNKYCAAEMIYKALHLKNPFFRMKNKLKVNIKEEEQTMYLRTPKQLKKIYQTTFSDIQVFPLLAFTPPYQSGYSPGKRALNLLRKFELAQLKNAYLSHIADQVVTVCRMG